MDFRQTLESTVINQNELVTIGEYHTDNHSTVLVVRKPMSVKNFRKLTQSDVDKFEANEIAKFEKKIGEMVEHCENWTIGYMGKWYGTFDEMIEDLEDEI